MCVWRHNQQFFTHEAALGPVVQIVENGLIWFGKRSFNVVNFQRPDWIVALLMPLSSSPGWYKYLTCTTEGSFISLCPTGLE